MDQLDRLRTFVAVPDMASFAGAARTLRISPAAATRAVAALEGALGVQLLRRTTRSVRPTNAGLLYLDRCRRILADLDDAGRLLAGEGAEPQGLLVVTAPVVFGRLQCCRSWRRSCKRIRAWTCASRSRIVWCGWWTRA